MTPFGAKLRAVRRERGMTQMQMAEGLGVSASYLSALERGKRGAPSFEFVQNVTAFLGFIWDDADELTELAGQSRPRVMLDTSGTSPDRTAFANLLAKHMDSLSREDVANMRAILDRSISLDRKVRADIEQRAPSSQST